MTWLRDHTFLPLALGIPVGTALALAAFVALGGVSTLPGQLVAVLTAATWLVVGFANFTDDSRLRSRLEKRLPQVLEEYRIGPVLWDWTLLRLFWAATDERVLAEPDLVGIARRVVSYQIAIFVPWTLLIVGLVAWSFFAFVTSRRTSDLLTLLGALAILAAGFLWVSIQKPER